MAEDFDRLLASALTPPERIPDRRFVAGVQARIALEEQLAQDRRSVWTAFWKQFLGVGAVAAGLGVVSRTAPVAGLAEEFPALALASLLAAFAFVLLVVSRASPQSLAARL